MVCTVICVYLGEAIGVKFAKKATQEGMSLKKTFLIGTTVCTLISIILLTMLPSPVQVITFYLSFEIAIGTEAFV